MSTLSKQPFISFYERKCLLHLYHAQVVTHFAACTLVGSWHVFLSWIQKCQRNSQQKSLKKNCWKSPQNDEEPQPLKKHQKSKIMNKEERNLAQDKKE